MVALGAGEVSVVGPWVPGAALSLGDGAGEGSVVGEAATLIGPCNPPASDCGAEIVVEDGLALTDGSEVDAALALGSAEADVLALGAGVAVAEVEALGAGAGAAPAAGADAAGAIFTIAGAVLFVML